MRVLARFVDLYLAPALTSLFGQANPKTRDPALVAKGLEETHKQLDLLEQLLGSGPYAVGASLSLADCALVPFAHFGTRALPMLGDKDPTLGRRKLAAWWKTVQGHAAVARVQQELDAALAEYVKGFAA